MYQYVDTMAAAVSILGFVLVVLLVPLAIVSVLVVVELFRPVSRPYVNRFLRRYPVRLTASNGPMVLRRLARVRAARTLGGLAGALFAIVVSVRGNSFNVLIAVAVGYLIGGVVAEVPSRRDRAAARRPAASLVPRQTPRLRAPFARRRARWSSSASPGRWSRPVRSVARRAGVTAMSPGRVAAGLAAMVLVTVLVLVTARAILYRRQPFTEPDMLSADDALRAASLHCVFGGGFAVVAILGSVLVWNVGVTSDVQLLRWLAPWLGLTLDVHRVLRVVRRARRPVARAPHVLHTGGPAVVIVEIDPGSMIPPYEQLRAQIAELVLAGTLAPGSRLPAVRQLAADLGVAPGTIARAYRELERGGVLATKGRHGTFVTDTPPQLTSRDRNRQLAQAAEAFAATAQRLGLSKRDALAQVRAALDGG